MDGTFFSLENEQNENVSAKCTECGEIKKGSLRSTGNFLSHYRKKHLARVTEIEEYSKSGALNKGNKRQPILEEVLRKSTDINV